MRGEELSPSLFPFLAVLLCTMGALVVILVVAVGQASASAKLSIEAQKEKLLEVSDFVELASDEMLARREDQQQAIDGKRSQLAGIEDHIDRLTKELKDLEEQAQAIDDKLVIDREERTAQQSKLAELEKRIREEQATLDAKRREEAAKPPAFAILPYEGKNGTTRRPIYLECTAKGVVIQPEGVLISMEDLMPPHGPGNPLDSSLRLIRLAYQRLDANASISTSPYPLLLVRPDGIKSFVLARSAMSGWDDQFGYELIDQNMPLAYPRSLPGLDSQLSSNLQVSRQRQAALVAAMPRRYGSNSIWEDVLEDVDVAPSEHLQGVASGGSNSVNNSDTELNWEAVDQLPSPMRQGRWEMVEATPRLGAATSSAQRPANLTGDAKPEAAQNAPDGPYVTSQNPITARDAKLAANSTQKWSRGSGNLFATDSPNAMQSWMESIQQPDRDALGSNKTTNDSSVSQSIGQGNAPPTEVPSKTSRPTGEKNAAYNPVDGTQQTQREFEATENQAQPGMNVMRQMDVPSSKNQDSAKAEAARSALSRSWTTRRRIVSGTAISRPVTIVVMPDRWFVMQDDRRDQVEKVITLESGPSYARQAIEDALDERIESWGVAVAGGRWEPKLQVQVAPRAETSYLRLEKLLEGSGYELERAEFH
jgi:hypothetical protein